MEQVKIGPTTRLLFSCRIDSKDDFEEKFERCFGILQNLSAGLSEKEVHDNLNTAVCKEKTHEEVCLGLLMSILTQPLEAAKYYRDLTLVTRDGLAIVLHNLNQLILEKYLKLNDVVRSQLLWLLREMIKTNVTNVDNLCLSLLRHAAGGDISQRNICLIDALLDIFQENRPWLEKFPFLVASVVYTYLRLIEDHSASHLASLRQREVTFMISLLREKTMDCLVIGRDLVRLLQNVARIPEFEILWKDLLSNPKAFGSNFLEIVHLLRTRTSRRFLQSRLTPDMERKLVFLTSQVRFGNHKRYQEWFQRQYLATPESQTLRCDLIRFIVGVIHPTNELLCSDIIPRWAVIGWLFTTCTLPVAASNAKLALFYDWLFFESEKDNIMNIEPAILVMHNSMRSHPAVTATLLDFLCRIIPNFYPVYEDKVRNGIFSSLRQILEKRVLPSLYPLFDSPKLDRELRAKIRETFREFCLPPNADSGKLEELSKEHCDMLFSSEVISVLECNQDVEPTFSDEEDDLIRLTKNAEERQNEEGYSIFTKFKSPLQGLTFGDDSSNLNLTLGSEELKVMIEQLHHEIDNEMRCQVMERIVQLILEDEVDGEAIPSLASCLANTFSKQISTDIFPVDNLNDETLVDSISTPLFVMFRNHFQLCKEEDNRRKLLARVLAELRIILPQTGYLLLYFLKIWGKQEEKREIDTSIAFANLKASVYEDFCLEREDKLDSCLLADLKQCHEDNIPLLCYLLPDIYVEFPDVAAGNIQLLHLVVSTIDSSQLLDLVCQIMQGHLKMFKKDSFIDLLTTSLDWESFEQYCFWQIVLAHDCPIDHVLPILSKLQYEKHAEALNHILSMLKKEKPSMELLKQLLTRQCAEGDTFVLTALKYWHREHQDKLGEFLATILTTRFPTSSPNKRKRSGTKYNQPSIFPTGEQVLGHLDIFRQHCTFPSELQLYHSECMQKALQQAQIASNDSLRKIYGDLFAFAEVNEENDSPIPMTMTASARKTIQGTNSNVPIRGGYKKSIIGVKEKSVIKKVIMRDRNTESSDLSSEEEEIVKPKQARKRKKVNPVHSDSD